ncbi:hypothetical protein GCM10009111_33110 [Colwellia asteriadis]|uniref:Ankyrin repeat domain-containing protein n=1 Tax=Colwellia asteriadis TaxID=517723 RepID=A0ABN1LC30_9GAMM
MSIRFFTVVIIFIVFSNMSHSSSNSQDEWLEILQNQSLATTISSIKQQNLSIESEQSPLLQAAIIYQKIELLEFLYQQGGLSRKELLSGHQASTVQFKQVWEYLLYYDELMSNQQSKIPLKKYRREMYFPYLALNFRLSSEPSSPYFSQNSEWPNVLNAIIDYKEFNFNYPDVKAIDGCTFIIDKLKQHYDLASSDFANFMYTYTVHTCNEDFSDLKRHNNRDIVNDAQVRFTRLVKKRYPPALYEDINSKIDFISREIKDKQVLAEIDYLIALGYDDLKDVKMEHYKSQLDFNDPQMLVDLIKYDQSLMAYDKVVSRLIYKETSLEDKLTAATLYLDAIKQYGYRFQNGTLQHGMELSSIKAQAMFFQGLMLQHDYRYAKKIALNIMSQPNWQQHIDSQRFVSSILNSILKDNSMIMALLIKGLDLTQMKGELAKINSDLIIDGSSLLAFSIKSKRYDLANYLLKDKQQIEEANHAFSSLYFAIENNNKQLINKLLPITNTTTYQKRYGYPQLSLLHLAVINNDLPLIKQLIEKGVPRELVDRSGFTALDWAVKFNMQVVADYLAVKNSN